MDAIDSVRASPATRCGPLPPWPRDSSTPSSWKPRRGSRRTRARARPSRQPGHRGRSRARAFAPRSAHACLAHRTRRRRCAAAPCGSHARQYAQGLRQSDRSRGIVFRGCPRCPTAIPAAPRARHADASVKRVARVEPIAERVAVRREQRQLPLAQSGFAIVHIAEVLAFLRAPARARGLPVRGKTARRRRARSAPRGCPALRAARGSTCAALPSCRLGRNAE